VERIYVIWTRTRALYGCMPYASSDMDLVTTATAARLIGVAEGTVRLMERRGELPAQRTASGIRLFSRAACEHAAETRRKDADTPRADIHATP
jgi:hypothetical protein